jgi:hypothetical protein
MGGGLNVRIKEKKKKKKKKEKSIKWVKGDI